MNCVEARESLESYISGDLEDAASSAVADHLRTCEECTAQYDRVRELAGNLRPMSGAFVPREVFDMSNVRAGMRVRTAWGWKLATVVALLLAGLASSALAFPAIAENLPALPVSKRIANLEADNERLSQEVEELRIEVQNIEGTDVPVVETAEPPLPPEVNNAVQSLVMRFVRAQYDGDLETLRALGTDKLDADLAEHPNDYLRGGGEAIFAQMTDVSLAGETYLVFVRLMDSAEWADSQYQEDFEILKIGDEYFVDFMGMDA